MHRPEQPKQTNHSGNANQADNSPVSPLSSNSKQPATTQISTPSNNPPSLQHFETTTIQQASPAPPKLNPKMTPSEPLNQERVEMNIDQPTREQPAHDRLPKKRLHGNFTDEKDQP